MKHISTQSMINTIIHFAIKSTFIRTTGCEEVWKLAKKVFIGFLKTMEPYELNEIFEERYNEELGVLYEVCFGLVEMALRKKDNLVFDNYWCERYCYESVVKIQSEALQFFGCYMLAGYIDTCEKMGLSLGTIGRIYNAA